MPITPADIDLIDRLAKPAIARASEDARKRLRQSTGETAQQGALGAGRFHLQIAELFVTEYRACGQATWAAFQQVLDAPGHTVESADGGSIKQLLLDRLVPLWQQLEGDVERVLKIHSAGAGFVAKLGDAHRSFVDELNAEVDLYLRHRLARTDTLVTVVEGALDELTKVPTRKALGVALTEAFNSVPTVDQPVSVVMVDVDNFKGVNDSHGHQKGDAVLVAVAARLSSAVAHKAQVYRYGGEEFLLLLRNFDVTEAAVIAERVRKAVEDAELAGLRMTISAGVASAPTHATASDDLIGRADSALYDAKKRGRNLVRIYGEPEPAAEKREPVRRQPVSGGWSVEETEEIRRQYFTSTVARCPKDGALLQIKKLQALGQATPMLFVHCELCGLHEQI